MSSTLSAYLKAVGLHFRLLSENAVLIQKAWKGYLARRNYRLVLDERVREMREMFYHEKASLVGHPILVSAFELVFAKKTD